MTRNGRSVPASEPPFLSVACQCLRLRRPDAIAPAFFSEGRRSRSSNWRVEVDETYIGGPEEGLHGRQTEKKALVVVAVEAVGRRHAIGRIRMRRVPDASADSLQGFIDDVIAPRSTIQTDAWLGYDRVRKHGYWHRIVFLRGQNESPAELLPRVHRVNRRTSRHRGKLFFRLAQQAVAVQPAPYKLIVKHLRRRRRRPHKM